VALAHTAGIVGFSDGCWISRNLFQERTSSRASSAVPEARVREATVGRRRRMTTDRYTKTVLTVIAGALSMIALNLWVDRETWTEGVRPRAAEAQVTPRYEIVVPKSWGRFLAYGNGNILLETPDGVLREVDISGRAPEYPKIKAQVSRP
jgi:hypothetical protein